MSLAMLCLSVCLSVSLNQKQLKVDWGNSGSGVTLETSSCFVKLANSNLIHWDCYSFTFIPPLHRPLNIMAGLRSVMAIKVVGQCKLCTRSASCGQDCFSEFSSQQGQGAEG